MASTIRIVTSENVTVNARSTRRIIDQYAVTRRANPPADFFQTPAAIARKRRLGSAPAGEYPPSGPGERVSYRIAGSSPGFRPRTRALRPGQDGTRVAA
jgi:hypothetical protein